MWGLGIPFFAFLLLRMDRFTLDKIETKMKFGFLYRGFKKNFYYWEIVIMYRKIMLIMIAIILARLGSLTQVILNLNYFRLS